MEPQPYGCSRRAILASFGLFGFLLLCGAITMLVADTVCYNGMVQKLPIYPQATVVFQRHSGFRAFGMGETALILESDDAVETVRNWYGQTVAASARMAKDTDNPFYYIPVGRYSVARAEDGTGAQIILSGDCIR